VTYGHSFPNKNLRAHSEPKLCPLRAQHF
jgi:hypothetical protein